jgi:hypothetical protein
LAEKVSEQSAAGQFAASLQTLTGLLDLIDKSSGGVVSISLYVLTLIILDLLMH